MREIFPKFCGFFSRIFPDKLQPYTCQLRLHKVSKQVKQRKTAIRESVHHQFIIYPGRVQTSGPLTIMTFSVIELFFNLT